MTSITARVATALIALAAAVFLSACTEPASDGHTDDRHSDEPVVTAQPAGYNSDDVAFAPKMIPHHQQAVEMSALVPDRSTNHELRQPLVGHRRRAAAGDRDHEGLPAAVGREPRHRYG